MPTGQIPNLGLDSREMDATQDPENLRLNVADCRGS